MSFTNCLSPSDIEPLKLDNPCNTKAPVVVLNTSAAGTFWMSKSKPNSLANLEALVLNSPKKPVFKFGCWIKPSIVAMFCWLAIAESAASFIVANFILDELTSF